MISVKKTGPTSYEVKVSGPSPTTHEVTLAEDYYQKLTRGLEPPESLIERSFEFLLRNEPNTSILRSFELPVISRYFPDYEEVIRKDPE